MGVYAGQGDPAWSMAALWRRTSSGPARPSPGPKPALTLDAIVAAAIEIADRDGLSALSMRAVGERLGRTAMALYTYVPGKNELIDLMYDQAHSELPGQYDLGAGWRAAITSWADDLGSFYLRHPWTVSVSYARPVLGPNEQVVVESATGILRATGLPATTLRRVLGVLIHLVRATAQTVAESRLAPDATGSEEHDWWSTRAAQLGHVAPDFAERFPMSAWLAEHGMGHDENDTARSSGAATSFVEREAKRNLSVGLATFLDGIEVAIANARNDAGDGVGTSNAPRRPARGGARRR